MTRKHRRDQQKDRKPESEIHLEIDRLFFHRDKILQINGIIAIVLWVQETSQKPNLPKPIDEKTFFPSPRMGEPPQKQQGQVVRDEG